MELKESIRIIKDFPKEGISFKDVTTLLKDPEAFKEAVDGLVDYLKDKNIDIVVGPEARGFIFGTPVAYALGAGFVPVRKKGKLPGETLTVEYELEYGTDVLEIHKDAIKEGQRVAVIDDLLATGGTMESVVRLIEKLGGEVVSIDFLIELSELKGRKRLCNYDVMSLIEYNI